MLLILIRYFFLTFCANYVIYKTTNNTYSNFLFSSFFVSCTVAFSASVFLNHDTFLRIFIMLLGSIVYTFICYNTKPFITLTTVIISYGLSYLFLFISGTIICIPFILLYKNSQNIPYTFIELPIGILQFISIYSLFQNQQFQKGLCKIIRNRLSYYGTIISFSLISYVILITNNKTQTNRFTRSISITLLLSVSGFLIYYWRHRITQTYRENMNLVYEKSLETEIANLKEEIQTLQTDNQRLTQIVHKDNKLVPAMESTVLEFLQSANTLSADELFARGDELSNALHEMAINRTGILTSLSPSRNGLPSSGFLSVDGLLSYMGNRANENKINYRFKIDDNIKDLISTAIHEEDLRHLLSDLIENAIIAVKCSELSGHISIHFGNLQDKFLLEISDNGIPFSPDSYQTFGNEPCSTHQEEGGTGTGLMDIWKLKKKYKASLYIYEYEPDSNIYTKKISFLFDGKNHFLLKTYRDKEIKNTLIRGDLHVFSNYSSNI